MGNDIIILDVNESDLDHISFGGLFHRSFWINQISSKNRVQDDYNKPFAKSLRVLLDNEGDKSAAGVRKVSIPG